MYDVFSLNDFQFPENFLWGSATAGHQIEGGNTHSGHYHREMQGPESARSGLACNGYELYRQDVELIAELGHQAYRFSVEWSRIEPEEGVWNQEAIDHYLDEMVRLKEKGIKVCLTLQHYTLPFWFEQLGGFTKDENLRYFERFAAKIAPVYSPYVDVWFILNEWFSALQDPLFSFQNIKAHARIYHLLKSCSKAPVSSAHMALEMYPNRYFDEFDQLTAALKNWAVNGVIRHAVRTGELVAPGIDAQECPEIRGAMDFWALNLYTRELADARHPKTPAPRFPHKKLRMIDMDFYLEEMYPEGTTAMIEYFKDERPVIVSENGCSCNDDRFRIVYLSLYLSAVHDAIRRGCDVRGYFYWSLLDNFEWSSFLPRFGLVDVDFKTFKRTAKPSAFFFRDIIRNNGFSQQILRKYLKELPTLSKQQTAL